MPKLNGSGKIKKYNYARKIFIRAFNIASTSSSVLDFPREIRTVPLAQSSSSRIDCKTCETSVFLLLHAEPVEIHIPVKSSRCKMASPSAPGNDRLRSPGSLFAPPFRTYLMSVLSSKLTSLDSNLATYLVFSSRVSQLFFRATASAVRIGHYFKPISYIQEPDTLGAVKFMCGCR